MGEHILAALLLAYFSTGASLGMMEVGGREIDKCAMSRKNPVRYMILQGFFWAFILFLQRMLFSAKAIKLLFIMVFLFFIFLLLIPFLIDYVHIVIASIVLFVISLFIVPIFFGLFNVME